jgi:HJR/Mrr/RecB family endonuclease
MEDDGAYLGCTYHFEESCLVCDECGWWTHHGISHYSVWPGESSEGRDFKTFESLSWGLVKTFSLESANPPLSELRRWLTQHPHDLAHVNPHAFEKLMAECFKDAYPSAEVLHVGKRTRDHGIDILIILHDREQILVQVKRRSDLTTNEGVEVVRSLNGVMLRQGIPKGIVVSTAKGFTAAAKDEALVSAANVASDLFFHRYQVELMCSSDVIKLLASSQDSEKPNKETILCSLPRMPYQRFVVGEADSGHYCPEDRRWEPLRDIAVRRHVDRLLGRL